MCFVINVSNPQGSELSNYMDDIELKKILKLYGQEKKKQGIIMKKGIIVETRYKQRNTKFPLIKLIDFEWRFPIGKIDL